MPTLPALYRHSLSLLTDLYQLTMAYGYWKSQRMDLEAVFHLFYRSNPFHGGYTVACGLDYVIDYLQQFHFEEDDLRYLATLTGADGELLFDPGFIDHLRGLRFSCDVDAMPEGTVAFPHEPLVRVRGPILQCQLLETALLNIINFQTLVATKAARVCQAAQDDSVLEFGLRRAQGIDGALAASRAAYVGGCSATSNVLAGKLFGIPVKGTHAHSWVMSFDDELEAFRVYAKAMPNNCVFLVDTYDTLDGVRKAIEVGHWLKSQGHKLLGVRLDSGDLAWLSIEARKLLDAAGFADAAIVASNDLDENLIVSLKQQGAKIGVWGVGTKLVTAYDQPALGGVYKLGAIREEGQAWQYRLKLSNQSIKISNPGILQVCRFSNSTEAMADMLYDEEFGLPTHDQEVSIIDPRDETRRKQISSDAAHRNLLVPIFRGGKTVYQSPTLTEIRAYAKNELQQFSPFVKRFDNPHSYPVGLEPKLHALKQKLIRRARGLE